MQRSRCELLSKIIIFVTRHNWPWVHHSGVAVVNCFQKLLSSWHDTTAGYEGEIPQVLWIAFKNYYLRDTTQLFDSWIDKKTRCELLSKIIIFVTRHNSLIVSKSTETVVNCFQKLLSSWHDTTEGFFGRRRRWLWIAFKNYYLRDTTQPKGEYVMHNSSCELLSKIIIFVTRHNKR